MNFCTKSNGLITHCAVVLQYWRFSWMTMYVDSTLPIVMPTLVEMSWTFILLSFKKSWPTRRMFSGVVLVCGQRSCSSISTVSRPSLNALAHLNLGTDYRRCHKYVACFGGLKLYLIFNYTTLYYPSRTCLVLERVIVIWVKSEYYLGMTLSIFSGIFDNVWQHILDISDVIRCPEYVVTLWNVKRFRL